VTADSSSTAAQIMEIITPHRRYSDGGACAVEPCPRCAAVHSQPMLRQIARGEPVLFVLPAFPGKSPNSEKVLGPLPDLAEALSLEFLNALCERVAEVYPPGARVIICSDGRVFNDVVGISDEDITAYQRELRALAQRIGPRTLELRHLDDVYPEAAHQEMREILTARYGEDLATVKARVHEGGDALAQYRGTTRFLLEDSDRLDPSTSRSARQRDSRERAYVVIQRSGAWSKLIALRFPDAVRLSIHPHACGADKIGIALMDAADAWQTAWHGVAVDLGEGFLLMKRREAESLGSTLVYDGPRPSHYRLTDPRSLPESVRAGLRPRAREDGDRATAMRPAAEENPHEPVVA